MIDILRYFLKLYTLRPSYYNRNYTMTLNSADSQAYQHR